ncbi:MAG: hypothetical protein JWN46_3654 [Acidimicrobiales bacterium]|nr:hypothetical protein [Acidimicrobiales bacterium]
MPTLDHLVYAVPDLDAACDDLALRIGVRPAPGGHHPGLGSRNALLALGAGAYLEVIGPDPEQPAPDAPRPFGLDDLDQPRLAGWAVQAADIDAAVAAARAAGYDPGPVVDLDRETLAGTTLHFRVTFPDPDFHGVVPFLIAWGDTVHPFGSAPEGATVVGPPTLTHPDPDGVARALAALDVDALVLDGAHPALAVTVLGPRRAHLLR